ITASGGKGISATCNWYGSAVYAEVAPRISGNISFIPFLTSGTDNDGSTRGFQPQNNTCNGVNVIKPTAGSSAGIFTNIGQTNMTLSFTKGNGSKRLIILRKGSANNANPVDDHGYTANAAFGSGAAFDSGYAVYNDTGKSVTVTNLEPGA